MNEEIQFLKRLIADSETVQRIEQLTIDKAKERLNQLESTTKAVFADPNSPEEIDKAIAAYEKRLGLS